MKMKYKNILTFLLLIIINFSTVTWLESSVAAQNICVPEPLVVAIVMGRVVSQLEKGETPLSNASVALLEDQYQGRLVAEKIADENGFFSFDGIKPGKYILKVSYPNLPPFYGLVRVIKAKALKDSTTQQEIVVTIGAEITKPCHGSHAKIKVKKATKYTVF